MHTPSPVTPPPANPGPDQPAKATETVSPNSAETAPKPVESVAPESAVPEPASHEPTPLPKAQCDCKDCARFTPDQEPYSGFKQQCEWAMCDITAAQMALKNCTRCYLAAYCCREHQRLDWSIHKDVCIAEDAAKIPQQIEEWRRWKAEAHHHPHA